MKATLTLLVFLLCVFTIAAQADTIFGPTYPAPGGNTYNSSGDPIAPGGATANYGNFNPAAYGQLWWTITDVANPFDSSFSNGTGNMAFAGYSNGVATWNSTANLTFFDPQLNQNISAPTRFLLANFTGGATYDTTPGTPAWNVSGDFSVDELLQAYNGSSWIALGDFYNAYNHSCEGGCLQTGFDGGFYYTSPTPEPGTLLTLGSGIIGLAGVARRRFSL